MRLTVTRSFKTFLVLLWLVLCIAVSDIGLGILFKKQLLLQKTNET